MSANSSAVPTLNFPDTNDPAPHDSVNPTVGSSDSSAGGEKRLLQFALLLIVISAVIMAVYLASKEYIFSEEDFASAFPPSISSLFEIDGASTKSELPVSPSVVATPDKSKPAVVAAIPPTAIDTEIRSLKSKLSSFEKTNKVLIDHVKATDATLAERDRTIDTLRSNLSDVTKLVLPRLAANDKRQDSMISDLNTSLNKSKRRRVTKKAIAKATKPPFTVVSVDEWDTTTSAVIELEGKSSVATVGDIRAGWRITSIARPYCIHTVRVAGGTKEVKVCVPGVM